MAACSEPPVKEHDQAVAAIAAAKRDGAGTYASDGLTNAEAALARYDKFVAERDYKQAFGAAIEARDLAFEAGQAASRRREALRADAERLAVALEAAVSSVDADLKARGRVPARHASPLRKARQAAALAVQEARKAAGRGEFTSAIERLNTASAALSTVRASAVAAATKAR